MNKRVWDELHNGGPQCSVADYHGDSMANLKLSVCDVTNTATEGYSASLELDHYLREEPVRRYVVTVPVAPLVREIFCLQS